MGKALAVLVAFSVAGLAAADVLLKINGTVSGPVNIINIGPGIAVSRSGSTVNLYLDGGTGGAPTNATYITQTPDGTLSNEQALSLLPTGFMQSTTTTGAVTTYTANCGANNFVYGLGVGVNCAQPAFSNLSGTASDAQLADSYSGVGSCASGKAVTAVARDSTPTCTFFPNTVDTFAASSTTKGMSISGNKILLTPADATNPGGLSSADWLTFNDKAPEPLDCTGTSKLHYTHAGGWTCDP